MHSFSECQCDWPIMCASIGSDLWHHDFSWSLKVLTSMVEPKHLGYIWFLQFWRFRHDITVVCVQPSYICFRWYSHIWLEGLKSYRQRGHLITPSDSKCSFKHLRQCTCEQGSILGLIKYSPLSQQYPHSTSVVATPAISIVL